MDKKALLIILDGWGNGDGSKADVISITPTPFLDKLKEEYPVSHLLACGEDVGLPEGQMGNSEVGHLNIGAGRVVYQDLVRINKAIRENSIGKNEMLCEAFNYAKDNDKAVHFIGLVSPGGVHSMDTHLYKLCDLTVDYGLKKVYIHALTDGRDTDPHSGLGYVTSLVEHLKSSNGVIASLSGRYYTMDRDKRWERIKEGYDLLVHGKGKQTTDVLQAIKESYDEGVSDEFIKPTAICDSSGNPIGIINEGDVVICFNFRTDRLREITIALTQRDFPEYEMKTMFLQYYTMTRYDESFKGIKIIYDKQNVQKTLGEILAENGKAQLRIAETEKYSHVTFFFSGGREAEFNLEERVMISSPKVATYDLKPEMSAFEVKDAVVAEIGKQKFDFICLNFANGDMVGHTGVYEAIQKAVRTVDQCVEEVVDVARNNGYTIMIIADHGNADYVLNEDGSPNTAHSLNPVPCILVSDEYKNIRNGILADVAPTILSILGMKVPVEMTGVSMV